MKQLTDETFSRWWQLKYFLFSPLPGEMIQFSLIFFKWVESTSFLIKKNLQDVGVFHVGQILEADNFWKFQGFEDHFFAKHLPEIRWIFRDCKICSMQGNSD